MLYYETPQLIPLNKAVKGFYRIVESVSDECVGDLVIISEYMKGVQICHETQEVFTIDIHDEELDVMLVPVREFYINLDK